MTLGPHDSEEGEIIVHINVFSIHLPFKMGMNLHLNIVANELSPLKDALCKVLLNCLYCSFIILIIFPRKRM